MVLNRVIELVAKELNAKKEDITLNTNLQNDLGADSLDAVELMMAVEEEFGILIPDEDAQAFRTIKDIVTFIEKNQ